MEGMLPLRIVNVAVGANDQAQLIVVVAVLQHVLPPLQRLQRLVLLITAADEPHVKRRAHEDDTLTVLVHDLPDVVVRQLRIIAGTHRNLNLDSVITTHITVQKPCNTL